MIIPRSGPLAGINTNYNDTAKFTRIRSGAHQLGPICERYTGNSTGAEPAEPATAPTAPYCIYSASDIT